jgi:hypothetical protein
MNRTTYRITVTPQVDGGAAPVLDVEKDGLYALQVAELLAEPEAYAQIARLEGVAEGAKS